MKTNKQYSSLCRGKWLYDGCKSIDEMVDRLVDEINYLRELRDAGVTLESEVCDDYVFLVTSDKKVADKYDFHEEENDEDE